MQLFPKDIKNCLDVAQNYRESYFAYEHSQMDLFMSVNGLFRIVRKEFKDINLKLSFHPDPHEEHCLNSFLVVRDNGDYEICLLKEMTNCWNRFALCKELFHVILDKESARNASVIDHLADFRNSIMDGSIAGKESSHSEILIEFAAMQFLFPYAKRKNFLEKIEQKQFNEREWQNIYMDIATQLRIPRLYVEEYLAPMRMDLFSSIAWNEKSDAR